MGPITVYSILKCKWFSEVIIYIYRVYQSIYIPSICTEEIVIVYYNELILYIT